MTKHVTSLRWAAALLALLATALLPDTAAAQGRGNGGSGGPTVEFSVEVATQVRDFYAQRAPGGVQALPPGIRRRLERGKPLPPGIAKQVAPAGLLERVTVPRGFELVEVGVDVLLVEVATNIIHDVLMDVIR